MCLYEFYCSPASRVYKNLFGMLDDLRTFTNIYFFYGSIECMVLFLYSYIWSRSLKQNNNHFFGNELF